MIQENDIQTIIQPDSGAWAAVHSAEGNAPGPETLKIGNDEVADNCTFYVDDLTAESAVLDKSRVFHRGGSAVIETQGHFPFGTPLKFKQTCRYAQNHLRVAFDLQWPRALELKRHLGIGCMNLPGQWARLYVYPPAQQICDGAEPGWLELPDPPRSNAEIMVGHWHRPPLALVFERPDKTRLEIGADDDIWRWNLALGHGPESGSFKIMLGQNGIRLVREPVMSCIPFTPRRQLYRFKWYAAWQGPNFPNPPKLPGSHTPLIFDNDGRLVADNLNADDESNSCLLDLTAISWPGAARHAVTRARYLRGERDTSPCWQSNATRNLGKKIIRQIKERLAPGSLYIRGLEPAPCWDPAHLARNAVDGLPHWDLGDILDFSVWTRRQLGAEWSLSHLSESPPALPSLNALFQPNGFDIEY
ncbi:MAG: hypothetical protein R6V56_04490 [Lentisphaeria bacterium]